MIRDRISDEIMKFLINYILPTIIFGPFFGFIHASIFVGIITGIGFTILLQIFINWQLKQFKAIKLELSKDYKIIFDDGANLFRNKEGVGGYLYLTTEKLIFKSHNFNIQVGDLEIKLKDIINVERVLTFKIIPNGIKITTSKESFRFVVNKPKTWQRKLKGAIEK